MYVYILSEMWTDDTPGIWTVGHYAPDGDWIPESDHNSAETAAERVHWLNGGDLNHIRIDSLHHKSNVIQ